MATFCKNRRTGAYDVIMATREYPGAHESVIVQKKNGEEVEVIVGLPSKKFLGKFGELKGVGAVIAPVEEYNTSDPDPDNSEYDAHLVEEEYWAGQNPIHGN